VGEHGGEQALAGDQTLARTQQLAHEAAALFRTSIPEHRGHLDRGVLPHEGARFGHGTFARIELDLDELELRPLDLEVDIVGYAGAAGVATRCQRP
jgi:hypothetical protein